MSVPIRVGTAGWSYKDWEGRVYPKPSKGFDPLAFLADFFDTIEVNNTFYRPQPAPVMEKWATRVAHAKRFRFSVKLWRRFTHERGEPFTAADVKQARAGLDALQRAGRLGAVLVQFPWSFKRTAKESKWLGAVLEAFEGLPLAVEVRHASWNAPDFYEELAERGAGFVNVDQPLFKNSMRPGARLTSHVGYIRVHGRNFRDWFRKSAGRDERYDYLYTPDQLRPWVARAEEMAEQDVTREVYVVTNNHFRGQAAVNAVQMKAMLERKQVDAPKELLAAFPDALEGFVKGTGRSRPWAEPAGEAPLHA